MSIEDPSDVEGVVRIGPSPSSFEMVVLGSGGGPMETDLSCYLLKPLESSWEQGCVSLEAGSGIGSLAQLIQSDPTLFPPSLFAAPHPDAPPEEVALANAARIFSYVRSFLITHAHLDHVSSLILGSGGLPPPRSPDPAAEAWMSIREVYGSMDTLLNLETVFGEKVWPDIAGFPHKEEDNSGKVLRFVEIPATPSATPIPSRPPTPPSSTPVRVSTRRVAIPPVADLPSPPLTSSQSYTPLPITPSSTTLSVLAFPISHGSCSDTEHRQPTAPKTYALRPRPNGRQPVNGPSSSSAMQGVETPQREDRMKSYDTSAFFIKSESTEGGAKEFCFFGDVEPDSISLTPRNRRVWGEVATRFAAGVLNTVFIECSYLSSRPTHLLYGHLSPPHILDELAVLISLLRPSSRPASLDGLTVCIIHCKETFAGLGESVRARIVQELRVGAKERGGGLEGVRWVGVRRGMRIVF